MLSFPLSLPQLVSLSFSFSFPLSLAPTCFYVSVWDVLLSHTHIGIRYRPETSSLAQVSVCFLCLFKVSLKLVSFFFCHISSPYMLWKLALVGTTSSLKEAHRGCYRGCYSALFMGRALNTLYGKQYVSLWVGLKENIDYTRINDLQWFWINWQKFV